MEIFSCLGQTKTIASPVIFWSPNCDCVCCWCPCTVSLSLSCTPSVLRKGHFLIHVTCGGRYDWAPALSLGPFVGPSCRRADSSPSQTPAPPCSFSRGLRRRGGVEGCPQGLSEILQQEGAPVATAQHCPFSGFSLFSSRSCRSRWDPLPDQLPWSSRSASEQIWMRILKVKKDCLNQLSCFLFFLKVSLVLKTEWN